VANWTPVTDISVIKQSKIESTKNAHTYIVSKNSEKARVNPFEIPLH
jgi:hypothetical protein